MRPLVLISFLGAHLWVGCNFTAARGFNECTRDAECTAAQFCRQKYCVEITQGCVRHSGDFTSADRVLFAALLPLSAADGSSVNAPEVQRLNAMAMAIDEGNLALETGKKFALVSCNTEREGDELARAQAQSLIQTFHLPALLTSGAEQTLAVADEATAQGVLVMSPNATAAGLVSYFDSHQQLVWRTAPSDVLQARAMVDVITTDFANDAAVKIGVLYPQTEYGKGLAEAVVARFTALEGPQKKFTLETFPYAPKGDFSQPLNDLVLFAERPDASILLRSTVFIGEPLDLQNAFMLVAGKAKLTLEANHRWLLSDSAKVPELLTVIQSMAFDPQRQLLAARGVAPLPVAGAASAAFEQRFQARYQLSSLQIPFVAHSYDAIALLMLSARWANANGGQLSGARLAEGLQQLSSGSPMLLTPETFAAAVDAISNSPPIDVEGASGPLNFPPDAGSPLSPYELWKIENGGFTSVRTIVPSPG